MLQINRRPLGLDDVLGGKLWNAAQIGAEDLLRIGYDARLDYLAGRQQTTVATFGGGLTAAAAGGVFTNFPANVTVPNDQAWWVHQTSMYITIAGASSVAYWGPLWVLNPAIGGARRYSPERWMQAVSGANAEAWIGWDCGFWLPPGSFPGVACGPVATGGGNPTCVIAVTYTPVQI